MLNYFLKKFTKIVLRIIILLFIFAFMLIFFLSFKYKNMQEYPDPNSIYKYVVENKSDLYLNAKNTKFLENKDIWSIRLDENGRVIESFNKPKEVKDRFKISDVARFTRYYLNDYPVFTYILNDGLILFAYPKGSLDKFPFNYYNFDGFIFDLKILLLFILIFLMVVFLFYKLDIRSIYRKLNPIQEAIENLFKYDYKKLEERGDLKEIASTINHSNKRYSDLKLSQAKWIRGISHDVRTPLSKITWDLTKLKNSENKETIAKINKEIKKISSIIEDLNLTIYLDSLNNKNFENIDSIKVIRKLIIDKINENPNRDISFDYNSDEIKMYMDENLFSRMIENVLNNSIKYTKGKINLLSYKDCDKYRIYVEDEGSGIDDKVIKRLFNSNVSEIKRHGFGLFISKQICEIHDGKFNIVNTSEGAKIIFEFNLK